VTLKPTNSGVLGLKCDDFNKAHWGDFVYALVAHLNFTEEGTLAVVRSFRDVGPGKETGLSFNGSKEDCDAFLEAVKDTGIDVDVINEPWPQAKFEEVFSELDPTKTCPLCAELGKAGVPAVFVCAWYNSIEEEEEQKPGSMPQELWDTIHQGKPPTRPKVIGMKVEEYEALPEEEKTKYFRGEKYGCNKTTRTCSVSRPQPDGSWETADEPSDFYFHRWSAWIDRSGKQRWSRDTCVHGAHWTGVVPCRECGSFEVMLQPYDPSRPEEEKRRLARDELEKRISNIRAGYEAAKREEEEANGEG
jgi:hypothetical protein